MTRITFLWIIAGTVCACSIAVVCWYFGSTYGTSARKGRVLLASAIFGGSGVCIAAMALILYQLHPPVAEVEGIIEAVQIHRGRRARSDLLIHTSSESDIAVHASGGSLYFRTGEHVKIRYQGDTGTILKAYFFATDGRKEGEFNGTEMWPPFFLLFGGAVVIFLGFRRYRRDPEGAAYPSKPDQHPYGSIDKPSLLHLSESEINDDQ
jgi:hypothetical protein